MILEKVVETISGHATRAPRLDGRADALGLVPYCPLRPPLASAALYVRDDLGQGHERRVGHGIAPFTSTPASRNMSAAARNSSSGMDVVPDPATTSQMPAWISVRAAT